MRYEKEKLEKLVSESNSYSEVTKKLGLEPYYGNRQTVKKYITKYDINTSHFGNYSSRKGFKQLSLDEILIKNSVYNNNTHLKNRLYKNGLKEKKCEMCGQGEEWMGKKMSLILDHINGINNDNRIENLRIVCPNCNATLPTHGGKNAKLKPIKNKLDKDICECGKEKSVKSAVCKECSKLKQRKIGRPPYNQLIKEISELGYCGTGRKYGVSDNAIRKWVKNYKKMAGVV
jgi:hypothetical protein